MKLSLSDEHYLAHLFAGFVETYNPKLIRLAAQELNKFADKLEDGEDA